MASTPRINEDGTLTGNGSVTTIKNSHGPLPASNPESGERVVMDVNPKPAPIAKRARGEFR